MTNEWLGEYSHNVNSILVKKAVAVECNKLYRLFYFPMTLQFNQDVTKQDIQNSLSDFVAKANSKATAINDTKKDFEIKIFDVDNSSGRCFSGVFMYQPTTYNHSAANDLVSKKLVHAFYGPTYLFQSCAIFF